jgi:hypothetical protein
MNKEQLLNELSNKIRLGEITFDEMMNRFDLTTVTKEVQKTSIEKTPSNFSVTKFLYGLGAIIVIIGVVLFTYQIWNDIGAFGRILVTLGLGFLITALGSVLYTKNRENAVGLVFHLIGGMLLPGGAFITISELGVNQNPEWPLAIIFGVLSLFYILINSFHKSIILTFFSVVNSTVFVYLLANAIVAGSFNDYTNLYAYITIIIGICYILLSISFKDTWNSKLIPVLNFFGMAGIQIAAVSQYAYNFGGDHSLWPSILSFAIIFVFYLYININQKNIGLTALSIINGTALIYSFTNLLLSGNSSAYSTDIYTYLTMVVGIAYILISYSFRNTWNSKLTEVLNFFGIIGLLGSAFTLIYDSILWQLFFFVLVISCFGLSIFVKSRIVLVISTLFLLSFISYITSEYFADSVGWPISLVVLGFIFIALGYMSITINKKYIKE